MSEVAVVSVPETIKKMRKRIMFHKRRVSRQKKQKVSVPVIYSNLNRGVLTFNEPLHGVVLHDREPTTTKTKGKSLFQSLGSFFSKKPSSSFSNSIKQKHDKKKEYLKQMKKLQNKLANNHSQEVKKQILKEMNKLVKNYNKKSPLTPSSSLFSKLSETILSVPKKIMLKLKPPPVQVTEDEILDEIRKTKRLIQNAKLINNKIASKKWTKVLYQLKQHLVTVRKYKPLRLK